MGQAEVKQLYSKYGEELKRYLFRRCDCNQIAADLTQETFVRLLHSDREVSLQNPRAYLYRIATNLLSDHFRAAPRRLEQGNTDTLNTVPDNHADPEKAALDRNSVQRLQQAINELPPRQREIIVLHKFDGLSYQEISERLGIAKNTVMVHMMRALSYCRSRVADHDD